MKKLIAVASLALAACSPKTSVTHWKAIKAANAVSETDPRAEGQFRFLYDAWGTEQQKQWPPADFVVGLQTMKPEQFGNQFEKYGFIADPDDDLPIGFKRGLVDSTQVHETCAACHTAHLPDGRLWLGAPNVKLDIERFRVDVDAEWVASGHTSNFSAVGREKRLKLGPGRTDAESGEYPDPVPAEFPPYYEMAKRKRTNYLGTGRNVRSEAYLSIFTFGAGDPLSTIKVPFPEEAHLTAFLDFFGNIAPPKGPEQDAALITKGKQVFASAKCDACHHPDDVSLDGVITLPQDRPEVAEALPGENDEFPHGVIQTDPVHRRLITSSGLVTGGAPGGDNTEMPDAGKVSGLDPGYINLLNFIGQNHLQVGGTDGYRTGYLGALWSRAPYLHNGSVPTLRDLLTPAAGRPKQFTRGTFVLDTTVPGNGNQGHEFGTQLSEDDKTALVAYLNSL